MSKNPGNILAEIVALAGSLPDEPAAYANLTGAKRRALRAELEKALNRLNKLSEIINEVRQPAMIFDPTSPKVIGKVVADALLLQKKVKLETAVSPPFYGAGVYAIYYRGDFDCYAPISGKDHPLYVGKADPAELHATTATEQGPRLYSRLRDHHRSLSKAVNLRLEDFDCRYLVVRSAWVKAAEDILIDWFKPVWNNEIKVCYGFGKHGDSASTRKNERSPWDTLHPGRDWATGGNNTPNRRSVGQIRADIAEHFRKYPIKEQS